MNEATRDEVTRFGMPSLTFFFFLFRFSLLACIGAERCYGMDIDTYMAHGRVRGVEVRLCEGDLNCSQAVVRLWPMILPDFLSRYYRFI